jgi:hypothetical protein
MYGCHVPGSASSKFWKAMVRDQSKGLDQAHHQDEIVRLIEKKYLVMKLRCRALGMIIPIPVADVLCGLFSEKESDRKFMIKTWELLETYSKERPLDRSDPNYPNRFFKEDGPIPILIASGINLPFAAVVHRPVGRGLGPFRWTDDEYRYAIFAMRAVSDSFF